METKQKQPNDFDGFSLGYHHLPLISSIPLHQIVYLLYSNLEASIPAKNGGTECVSNNGSQSAQPLL